MKQQLTIRQLYLFMSTLGVLGFSNNVFATGYQLWEQDAASIGNYHAGRAAEVTDASISYYNPAGLVRIHNQQIVIGVDPIVTSFKYNGTIQVSTISPDDIPVTAQGGTFNAIPFAHYAAPLLDNLVFGLSIVSPFGLRTDYDDDTALRYAATLTSLQVVDVAPALGFAINDKLSLGIGLDAEHAKGEFNLVATAFDDSNDTEAENSGSSYAYGFHIGLLYQCNESTRIGLSYHSKITHHLHGDSEFEGPLADIFNNGEIKTDDFKTNAILPATTTLSGFHRINPRWDIMGSVIYTQWDVFDQAVLKNVAGIENSVASDSITVVIPENYHNTWNFSVGTNYHATDCLLLRAGIGYDQTPTNDDDRNVELPDESRIVLALGGHYQLTKTLGFDIGWSHYFVLTEADINNNVLVVGDQTSVTNGDVKGSADVYGFQMKWDIL